MANLRIAHVISALPVGGVERNLERILPLLKERGFDVQVVCTRERGALADPIEALGIPVNLVHLRTRYDPFSLRRLGLFLKEQKIDLIQCHMRRANTSGRLAAMLGGIKGRIITEHNRGTTKNWKHWWIDGLLARYTDAIIGVSQAVIDINVEKAGIPAEKFRKIYCGLDLDPFRQPIDPKDARDALGLPQETRMVGFIGRLHPIKNIPIILQAMAEPPMADTHLALVGDGRPEIREEYVALTKQLGIADRIHWLGFRDDLATLYKAMDCIVMASQSEGIATVQIEAFAAQIPLVSTALGFALESLTPDKHYICVPEAEPKALAECLARAFAPATAEQLRSDGREILEAFTVEHQVDQLCALYREVAALHDIPTTG